MSQQLSVSLQQGVIAIGDQRFPTAQSLVDYFNKIINGSERYEAEHYIMSYLIDRHHRMEDYIGRVYDGIQFDPMVQHNHLQSPIWQQASRIAVRARENRNKAEEELRKLRMLWPEQVLKDLNTEGLAHYTLVEVRRVAERFPFQGIEKKQRDANKEKVKIAMDNAVIERLSRGGRGISTTLRYAPMDFKAVALGKFDEYPPVSDEQMEKLNVRLASNGYGFEQGYAPRGRAVTVTPTPSLTSLPAPRERSVETPTPSPAAITGVPPFSQAVNIPAYRPSEAPTRSPQPSPTHEEPQVTPRRSERLAIGPPPTRTTPVTAPTPRRRRRRVYVDPEDEPMVEEEEEVLERSMVVVGEQAQVGRAIGGWQLMLHPVLDIGNPMQQVDWTRLRAETLTLRALDAWVENGDTAYGGCFAWMVNDEPFLRCLIEEIESFLHHYRPDPQVVEEEDPGWLRNCVHSLAQFAIRTDPNYYFYQVLLRQDHKYALLAYPHALRMDLGPRGLEELDDLDWRIEPSIEQLREGRGAFDLQGAVYLRGVGEYGAEITMGGLHRPGILDRWTALLHRRGLLKEYLTHLGEDDITEEDKANLRLSENQVRPTPGMARFFDARLPYRKEFGTGRGGIEIPPFFMGLETDLETLEVRGCESRRQISEVYHNLVQPASTPSGLVNPNGAVEYRYPTLTSLRASTAIGEALLGHYRWDHPAVLLDLSVLFGPNDDKRQRFITKAQARTRQEVMDHCKTRRKLEERFFGINSYYRRGAVSSQGGDIPMLDV